jgi:hypothetical protein
MGLALFRPSFRESLGTMGSAVIMIDLLMLIMIMSDFLFAVNQLARGLAVFTLFAGRLSTA